MKRRVITKEHKAWQGGITKTQTQHGISILGKWGIAACCVCYCREINVSFIQILHQFQRYITAVLHQGRQMTSI